jgi:hypothetical protein
MMQLDPVNHLFSLHYSLVPHLQEYYKLPGCEEAEDVNEALYITSRGIIKDLSEHGLIEDYQEGNDTLSVQSSVFGGEERE